MQSSSLSAEATTEALPPAPADGTTKIGVLFIILQLSEIGGAERVLASMIAGLPKDRLACSIITLRIDPRKIVTLYNGVSLEKSKTPAAPDLRAEMSKRMCTALISTVANLRKIKGIDIFIRAAAIVSRQLSEPVLFAIAGENLDASYA